MESTKIDLSPEEQLVEAQREVAELQQKIAAKSQEKVQKTLQGLSDAARKRQEQEAEERKVLAEIAKRRKEREEAEQAEQLRIAEQSAKERRLREEQVEHEKAERAKRDAELERVQRERAKAQHLEQELAKLENEILRGLTVEPQRTDKPAPSVMGLLFGDRKPASEPVEAVDSVEVAKQAAQQKKQQIESQIRQWSPIRKTQRYPDPGLSGEVEKQIYQRLKIRANVQRLDALSSQWDYRDLMHSVELSIQQAEMSPLGHDSLLFLIERTLEDASNA